MATTQLGPNTVNTVGELPAVGSQAPGFDLVDLKFGTLTDADVAGKRVVLNIFPSIDTGVCQASVRKFNELASGLDNTAVVNVSVDLPLAPELERPRRHRRDTSHSCSTSGSTRASRKTSARSRSPMQARKNIGTVRPCPGRWTTAIGSPRSITPASRTAR